MTVICTGTGALADDLADGKSLYKQGQYNKAAEAFKRVIEKDGRNSTAHYYMANCYVAKHDWNEAKAEYRSAASLTNDEKVRDYCLGVVANLESSHPSASSSGSVSSSGSGSSDFDRAQARLTSVLGQGQSEAKFVMEQAERDCARVNQEKNAALMPLQGMNIRSQTVYHSEEEKQAVAAPYDRQIAEIRSRAQARANSLMQDAQKRGNEAKLQ
jgi:tetratricopeptide (TPR) repeat protein